MRKGSGLRQPCFPAPLTANRGLAPVYASFPERNAHDLAPIWSQAALCLFCLLLGAVRESAPALSRSSSPPPRRPLKIFLAGGLTSTKSGGGARARVTLLAGLIVHCMSAVDLEHQYRRV